MLNSQWGSNVGVFATLMKSAFIMNVFRYFGNLPSSYFNKYVSIKSNEIANGLVTCRKYSRSLTQIHDIRGNLNVLITKYINLVFQIVFNN